MERKEIFLVSSGVGISVLSVSSDESEETEELSETVPGAETSAVPMK